MMNEATSAGFMKANLNSTPSEKMVRTRGEKEWRNNTNRMEGKYWVCHEETCVHVCVCACTATTALLILTFQWLPLRAANPVLVKGPLNPGHTSSAHILTS